MNSGTFDATKFDRFLSDSCGRPEWLIITGQSREDVLSTLESMFPHDHDIRSSNKFKWVELVEGSWEEIANDADSSE